MVRSLCFAFGACVLHKHDVFCILTLLFGCTVAKTLQRNLTTQSELKNGITLHVHSHEPAEIPEDRKVHVFCDIQRTPTATIFGAEHVDGQTIDKAKAHQFLGENVPAAMASAPPNAASKLAQEVFAVPLGGLDGGPSAASFTTSSVQPAKLSGAPEVEEAMATADDDLE